MSLGCGHSPARSVLVLVSYLRWKVTGSHDYYVELGTLFEDMNQLLADVLFCQEECQGVI